MPLHAALEAVAEPPEQITRHGNFRSHHDIQPPLRLAPCSQEPERQINKHCGCQRWLSAATTWDQKPTRRRLGRWWKGRSTSVSRWGEGETHRGII